MIAAAPTHPSECKKNGAILIFDTWSPFLSEAERELTRTLTTYIAEYYGTRSNRFAA